MKTKKKRIHFSVWYLLLALWVLILINSYFMAPQEVKITYSQFKNLLTQERVKEVIIDKEKIKGKALIAGEEGEKEKAFVTIRVEDPDLVKDLRQYGVIFSGRRENTFLKNLRPRR